VHRLKGSPEGPQIQIFQVEDCQLISFSALHALLLLAMLKRRKDDTKGHNQARHRKTSGIPLQLPLLQKHSCNKFVTFELLPGLVQAVFDTEN
jgi:hypothetical protein